MRTPRWCAVHITFPRIILDSTLSFSIGLCSCKHLLQCCVLHHQHSSQSQQTYDMMAEIFARFFKLRKTFEIYQRLEEGKGIKDKTIRQ